MKSNLHNFQKKAVPSSDNMPSPLARCQLFWQQRLNHENHIWCGTLLTPNNSMKMDNNDGWFDISVNLLPIPIEVPCILHPCSIPIPEVQSTHLLKESSPVPWYTFSSGTVSTFLTTETESREPDVVWLLLAKELNENGSWWWMVWDSSQFTPNPHRSTLHPSSLSNTHLPFASPPPSRNPRGM